MFLYAEFSCLIQTVAGFVVHLIEIPRAVSVKTDPAFPNITFFTCRSSKLTVYRINKNEKTQQNIIVSCELKLFLIHQK
jgi:hypothetical protein